jgi:hypothetical protein
MKRDWFRRWGWIYRPVAVPGWLVVAVAAAFCINVFVVVDRHSHSVSDTLYGVFPFVVPTLGIVAWIASHTSEPGKLQD